ncbi:MAG: tetratricopeptide repeat protein [Verrucomicrobiota bacterium]
MLGRLLLLSLLLLASSPAQEIPLAEELRRLDEYAKAERALEAGLVQVASLKFGRLLQRADLSEAARATIEQGYLESCVRAGKSTTALAVSYSDRLLTDAQTTFWRGLALAGMGRFTEAVALLEEVSREDSPSELRRAALLSRASLLVSLSQPEQALAQLARLPHDPLASLKRAEIRLQLADYPQAAQELATNDPQRLSSSQRVYRSFLKYRLDFLEGRLESAEAGFRSLLEPGLSLPRKLREMTQIGLAETLLEASQDESAQDALLLFIEGSPESLFLSQAFSMLAELPGFAGDDLAEDFARWVQSDSAELRAIASYYQALQLFRLEKSQEAHDEFRRFLDNFPRHFLQRQALLHLVSLAVTEGDRVEITALFQELEPLTLSPAAEGERIYAEARAYLETGEYARALEGFRELAQMPDLAEELRQKSAYHLGLSAIPGGDGEDFQLADQLLQQSGSDELEAQLLLEAALWRAKRPSEEAQPYFQEFLNRSQPTHPRHREGVLAFVEWILHREGRNLARAEEALASLEKTSETAEQQETRLLLQVRLQEASGRLPEAAEVLGTLVTSFPESAAYPAHLLKLGELHYRMRNFARARVYFESLAEKFPTDAREETALYFAGCAAMYSMGPTSLEEATELFQQVIDRDGEFLLPARRKQAELLIRQGTPEEAVALLDSLISELQAEGAPRDVASAMLLRARALPLVKTEDVRTQMQAAAQQLRPLLADSSLGGDQLNEAAYQLGRLLTLLERPDEALEVYHDRLFEGEAPPQNQPPGYGSLFRCGLAAISLLESRQHWEAAARIADRLTRLPGPRASEAQELAKRIRLQHMLWD